MTIEEKFARLEALRAAIRNHRDQKGDDRCWIDDYSVWGLLNDTPAEPRALPNYETMMKKCSAFYEYRRLI